MTKVEIGSIRGKSAYEQAVAGGYTGTEAAFDLLLAQAVNDTISAASVVDGDLVVTKLDGTTQNLGRVRGEDGSNVIPTNTAVKNALSDPEVDSVLTSNFAAVGESRNYYGAAPLFEWANFGAGSLLHLLPQPGGGAPYALGIGVDHDDSPTGLVISVKGDRSIGAGVTLEETSGADAFGLIGQNFSSGELFRLVQGSAATGPLVSLRNDYGGSGDLLRWSSADKNYFGHIDHDGNVERIKRVGAEGENNYLRSTVGLAISETRYHHSGSPDLWFSSAITSFANRLLIQQGGPAAIGGETMQTVIDMKGGNKIAFLGNEAIPRQTGVAVTAAGIHAALVNLGLIGA